MVDLLSDTDLVRDVGDDRAAVFPVHGILQGAGSKADPFKLPAGPLELLLAIGRSTSAIFSDRRADFEVASQWAILRWGSVFDTGPGGGIFSDSIDLVRHHHKTDLSEDLGLGLSLLASEILSGQTGFGAGDSVLVDVDSMADWGNLSRPDLLIFRPSAVRRYDMFVIESKGTGQPEKKTLEQLGSGIDQVLAVIDPPAQERLVVSAQVMNRNLLGRAIAVEPTGRDAPLDEAELDGDLERRILENERVRLERFAGIRGPRLSDAPQNLTRGERDIVGSSYRVDWHGNIRRVTIGVERDALELAQRSQSLDEVLESRGALGLAYGDSRRDQGLDGSLLAGDGCFLSVESEV